MEPEEDREFVSNFVKALPGKPSGKTGQTHLKILQEAKAFYKAEQEAALLKKRRADALAAANASAAVMAKQRARREGKHTAAIGTKYKPGPAKPESKLQSKLLKTAKSGVPKCTSLSCIEATSSNLNKWIVRLKRGKRLAAKQIEELCKRAIEIFMSEGNVCELPCPVTVCGDLHGQFLDLLELFRTGGRCPDTNYLFMGDYINRGNAGVETMCLLLALKVRYPNRITLLRGHQESRVLTKAWGFYDECFRKYGNSSVWKCFTDLMDYLPLTALIDSEMLCVHGGITRKIDTLDEIREIERPLDIPLEGGICDLIWSDPDLDYPGWGVSPRGIGHLFGKSTMNNFFHFNKLKRLARGHQFVKEGYYWCHRDQVVTVFSTPNYCYRTHNQAAIMNVGENFEFTFVLFDGVAGREESHVLRRKPIKYNIPT